MKVDEKAAIPLARQSRADNIKEGDIFHQCRSFEGHHAFVPTHYFTFDRSRSPPRAETGQLDRPSRYTSIESQSAPALPTYLDDPDSSRQNPIGLEGMPLNEREKKWWNEESRVMEPFLKQ